MERIGYVLPLNIIDRGFVREIANEFEGMETFFQTLHIETSSSANA